MSDVSNAPASLEDLSLSQLEELLQELNEFAQEVSRDQRRVLGLIAERSPKPASSMGEILPFVPRSTSNHLGAVESGG